MAEPTTPAEAAPPVTEDVVRDLLPLYFDGQASADTQALVETWFARRPEFARAARREADALGALGDIAAPPMAPQAARAELRRIRRLILVREVTQGLAGALTLLPILAMAVYFLLPTRPSVPTTNLLVTLIAWCVVTLACWALFIRSKRQARSDILD
jgi:ferric-dicitrate binding protein FerR (iron transport regulator)